MSELTEFERKLAGQDIANKLDAPKATLARVAAALEEPETSIIVEPFYHEGLKMWLDVLQMDLAGYEATKPENYEVKLPNGKPATKVDLPNVSEINLVNQATVYLMHGVQMEDGSRFDRATAYNIAKRNGWGSTNLNLIEAVDRHNPRYSDRLDLWTVILARMSWVAVVIDYYSEHHMLPELAKSLGETDETVVAMMKYKDSFRATANIKHIAKELGVDIEKALKLRAEYLKEQAR